MKLYTIRELKRLRAILEDAVKNGGLFNLNGEKEVLTAVDNLIKEIA